MSKKNKNIQEDIELEMEDEIVEESGMSDKMKKLRQKLKTAEVQAKENMDGWQRARADYVNLQKSFDGERSDIRRRAQAEIIEDILPSLDNFDAAMANTEVWEKVDENWRRGIEYISQQLHKTLEDYGVAKIAETKMFDPEFHEPLEVEEVDDESQDNNIVCTIQNGYTLNGKVMRPAKVKVCHYKN